MLNVHLPATGRVKCNQTLTLCCIKVKSTFIYLLEVENIKGLCILYNNGNSHQCKLGLVGTIIDWKIKCVLPGYFALPLQYQCNCL